MKVAKSAGSIQETCGTGIGWDPVHESSGPDSIWSRTNVAETLPGVATPLGWSVWAGVESVARRSFHAIGALSKGETEPDPSDRFVRIFYGRPSVRVEFMCELGDRLPGTSGEAIAEQILSYIPAGFVSHPQRRYYGRVAVRLPLAAAQAPRRLRNERRLTEAWWRTELGEIPAAGRDDAVERFGRAVRRFQHCMYLHSLTNFTCVQPVFDQLIRLVKSSGGAGEGLMAGYGAHEETQVIQDLWLCSRGRLDLEVFFLRHGYHGPREGEISSRVWREDPAPIQALLAGYRAMPDDAEPVLTHATKVEERAQAETALLAALPRSRRGLARVVLALAPRCLPLRGVGKVMFLQSLDIARAAARRVGVCLAEEGVFQDPEDIFFLTSEELLAGRFNDVAGRVAARRQRHTTYQGLELPLSWRGSPQPVEGGLSATTGLTTVQGTGCSPGIVEGRIRVVLDPASTEFEQGEILVGETTDPSWVAIMFLASGLIMDIGGVLSHAAVVARELGIPCVADTKVATKVLRTGDLCRIDGTNGSVEILARAGNVERDG